MRPVLGDEKATERGYRDRLLDTVAESTSASGPRARPLALKTTRSGAPCFSSTCSKSEATADASEASTANGAAPISSTSDLSLPMSLAATATFTPNPVRRRATEALIPGPVPTISALRYGNSDIGPPLKHPSLQHMSRAGSWRRPQIGGQETHCRLGVAFCKASTFGFRGSKGGCHPGKRSARSSTRLWSRP